MENQVLEKLNELKIHIDRRLDEIKALFQSPINGKADPLSINEILTKEIAEPQILSTFSLLNHGSHDILVDLSTNIQPVVDHDKPNQLPVSNGIQNIQSKKSPVLNGIPNIPKFAFSDSASNPMKYFDVEYGKTINFSLSYIFSTRSFFIHQNYDKVENFYINFNEYYSSMIADNDISVNPSSISIMDMCCVLNVDDSSYYRAQVVKKTHDDQFLVRFVDFGDIKLVKPNSMFKLFPEYANIPIFAMHCYLDIPWTDDLSQIETAFLDFLTTPNSYCIDTRGKFKPSHSSKMLVSLEIKTPDGIWKNIKDCNYDRVTVADCVAKYIFDFKDFAQSYLTPDNYVKSNEAYRKLSSMAEKRLSDSNTYSGICTNVSDISNFIFTQSSAIEFTTNISFFYRAFVEQICTDVKINSLVVFGIENKFYFRGFVLSIDSKKYELFSIDFGFIVLTTKDDIFPLFEDFSLELFPIFSAQCALDNIVPMLDTWSPVALKTFQTFVQGTFTIFPKGFSNGNYSVEIEMANKNRATEMLKKFKLGKDELL